MHRHLFLATALLPLGLMAAGTAHAAKTAASSSHNGECPDRNAVAAGDRKALKPEAVKPRPPRRYTLM